MKHINIVLIILFFANTLFADLSKDNSYFVDMVVKTDAICKKDLNKFLKCKVWYEKNRFTINSVVATKSNTGASWGKKIGVVGGSGGLLLPFIFFIDDIEDLSKNSVMVTNREMLEKIPAKNEKITISYNGFEQGEYRTDLNGEIEFKITEKRSGVYGLMNSDNQYGTMLKKEFYIKGEKE